jgi:hypothetical protein
MKSKTSYDFVLWAIPRFHRAGAEQKRQSHSVYFLNARFDQTPRNAAWENPVPLTILLPADNSEQAAIPYTQH